MAGIGPKIVLHRVAVSGRSNAAFDPEPMFGSEKADVSVVPIIGHLADANEGGRWPAATGC